MKNIFAEKRLKSVVTLFIKQHKDSHYDAAIAIMLFNQSLTDQAIDLLSDAQADMRETACFILAEIDRLREAGTDRTERFLQGVTEMERLLAHDPKFIVRAAAATSLGKIQVPSTIPALVKAAHDRSSNVRFAVASALGFDQRELALHMVC